MVVFTMICHYFKTSIFKPEIELKLSRTRSELTSLGLTKKNPLTSDYLFLKSILLFTFFFLNFGLTDLSTIG